jgi:hypothetical protein
MDMTREERGEKSRLIGYKRAVVVFFFFFDDRCVKTVRVCETLFQQGRREEQERRGDGIRRER